MTDGAAGEFVGLAVAILIVGCAAVAVHGHDVGEDGAGSVVLVCVEEDAESLELVSVAKDVAGLCALLGEPHGKAITIQVALTVYLKLKVDLVV